MDAADITSGPQKKRIDMEIAAIFPPQAMIRGCRAINKPKVFHVYFSPATINTGYDRGRKNEKLSRSREMELISRESNSEKRG